MNVLGIHVKCTRERRIQLKLPAVDEIAHHSSNEENGEPCGITIVYTIFNAASCHTIDYSKCIIKCISP